MDQRLDGAVALVTGGSKGFGVGIAKVLKEAGADVRITGRDEATLAATAERIGVRGIVADVASPADWDRVMADITDEFGRLDILVNNAGAGVRIAPLDEHDDEEIAQSIAVNLTGSLFGCRRAAALMKKQRSGTIVNVASVCASQAWPGWSVYSAAKAGMVQFGKCLQGELRESGVRVTSVMPSWGATEFLPAASMEPMTSETREKCIQPDELGRLVLSICTLPTHLVIQDVTLWPMVQDVTPL
ncbi:putative oxidoreductase [Planctomycetes bacterium Pan216]|uniref:Putative oxidoreductase n=1 Tax=Kolteria novifilia TaxID=2527975 RepID=A0A518AX35_9BACT|nr:putative oxidoreductase [Planctomycetes bacterium Pan216]